MIQDRWVKLDVWRVADDLACRVYEVTRSFPRAEAYGATSQLRRAALSIPTNIVEGYGRRGDRELRHFVNISLGSLAEVKYLLHFVHRIGYLCDVDYEEMIGRYNELGRMLWSFYGKIARSV
ncbi:MAG: four helix bundle protein [Deltaproteobacteria bacterium]|nr:four helix bundle protein [Deltaproteobacteria bacterium]